MTLDLPHRRPAVAPPRHAAVERAPAALIRRLLIGKIEDMFHDRGRGETPVERSASALFPPRSVIWRVHGDVTTMMIGGITALLLQMLHPAALAGVWDHSDFRADMLGRLRRTARFIALTTYADHVLAEAAIERVRIIHQRVSGALPDGSFYRASDPALLAWVHVAEATCFLNAWIAYGEPAMSRLDQDAYFAQSAVIARKLGADPVPESRVAAEKLLQSYRPQLRADHRTRHVAQLILHAPPRSPIEVPAQIVLTRAAIDLLPAWARSMHGINASTYTAPLIQGGAAAIARTLRWAFAYPRGRNR